MGHLGVALGSRTATHRQLGLLPLCLAAVGPDLMDFALEAGGRDGGGGLWTHSFASMAGYAALLLLMSLIAGQTARSAWVIASVGASHLLLDLPTSRMALWPAGPPVGLHLYRYPLADWLIESAVVMAGWLVYRHTLPPGRRSSAGVFAILSVLLAMQTLMAASGVR